VVGLATQIVLTRRWRMGMGVAGHSVIDESGAASWGRWAAVSNLEIKNKKLKWWGARTICETARPWINIVSCTYLTCCISCYHPMALWGGG
jgi:hypothetical protein